MFTKALILVLLGSTLVVANPLSPADLREDGTNILGKIKNASVKKIREIGNTLIDQGLKLLEHKSGGAVEAAKKQLVALREKLEQLREEPMKVVEKTQLGKFLTEQQQQTKQWKDDLSLLATTVEFILMLFKKLIFYN